MSSARTSSESDQVESAIRSKTELVSPTRCIRRWTGLQCPGRRVECDLLAMLNTLSTFPGVALAELLDQCVHHFDGGAVYPVADRCHGFVAGGTVDDSQLVRSAEIDTLVSRLWSSAVVFDPSHLWTAAAGGADHLMSGGDSSLELSDATAAALGAAEGAIRSAHAYFFFGTAGAVPSRSADRRVFR